MNAEFEQLEPFDAHNQALAANVHPSDWTNPTPDAPYHLVVVGAGTAGLVTAAGAAGLGARVALVERELMGGDCLNVGCVPSKAIIASARDVIHSQKQPDFPAVMERMRTLRAKISPADSAKRFEGLGVDVYFGQGTFTADSKVLVRRKNGEQCELSYRKAVIATGARASAPPIPGLEGVDYLTNETLFSLTKLPERLGVIGGGPIGCEMAQAFARLGSKVTLFERASHVMSREDKEAAEIVQKQLIADGVNIVSNAHDLSTNTSGEFAKIDVRTSGRESYFEVDQLLVAVGRAPNVDGLGLESAGVNFTSAGVSVDDHLRTSNPKIFAAGDICSQKKFTHAADFQARIVIQNALFAVGPFGRKRVSDLIIPWATYTSPEIAHVGVYADEAETAGTPVDTYTQHLADVDRTILEGEDVGFVRVHTQKGTDKILGATIVCEGAGDLISEITVAMKHGVGLSGLGSTIHPYPTKAEAIRRLGDQFNRTRLTPTSKRVLNLLRRINVGK